MPANLSPEYEKAERRYREAVTDANRVEALQDMLATIPKHKGTEKMQADIKHRLSQLRKEQQKPGQSKGPDPFHIPKSGAGQVVLTGLPNSGKSSLLAATTHAHPHIADYPFTTLVPQPGMWTRGEIPIELIDTPPLAAEHIPPGLLGTLHSADIVALVVEASDEALDQVKTLLDLLDERGLSLRTVPVDQLDPSRPDIKTGLILWSKAEQVDATILQALLGLGSGTLESLPVSARTGIGLNACFDRLWTLLARVRVYTKQPGKPPDLERPFTLPAGSTVCDLARLIHRDLPETMRFARLWGHGRFDGQQVRRDEPLQDRDVVEIHG